MWVMRSGSYKNNDDWACESECVWPKIAVASRRTTTSFSLSTAYVWVSACAPRMRIKSSNFLVSGTLYASMVSAKMSIAGLPSIVLLSMWFVTAPEDVDALADVAAADEIGLRGV